MQAIDSMKDQTLQSIDDNVVSAAEFLGGFDETKQACLRAYAESQGIIQYWIKKETRVGFKYIQKYLSNLKYFRNLCKYKYKYSFPF